MTIETLALQGNTTIYSSMAATIGHRLHEIRNTFIRDCFADCNGMEHRLEFVANVHGIEFINDSKATNVNSTWYALESLSRPIIWIAGGVDNGKDMDTLLPLVKRKVKAIVWLGKETQRLQSLFDCLDIQVFQTQSMDDAVDFAYFTGRAGDIVLLSPACPSFDLFSDYEERGKEFKCCVRNL
jgi:UDP-N-acetylmuramoylalanine--D-glutamate ligase